jgi:hypothetical protein
MTLEEYLKTKSARLSDGYSWLVWSEEDSQWVVYKRPLYAKKNIVLYSGSDLEVALEALVKDNE